MVKTIRLDEESAEWLEGVCDLHIYCLPSVYMRQFDQIEMAKQCRDVGYRAILVKCHHCINADAAYLTSRAVPGIKVFGGVVLNWEVGGLNPAVVDAAIMMGGKEVWMPNRHAGQGRTTPIKGDIYRHNIPPRFKDRKYLMEKEWPPINILTPEGDTQPILYEIFDLIAEADIILGTSHISIPEAFALVKSARSAGVKKMLITHPSPVPEASPYWTVENLKKITEMGAIAEFNVPRCQGWAKKWVEAIKAVGPSRCVVASGLGAWGWIHPIEGMRNFTRQMRLHGISEADINLMTKETPAKLLGLEI